MKIRYLIYGTGAIGSVFGGLLLASGFDVTFVGRGEHFNTMLKEGLRITGIWGDYFLGPEVIRPLSPETTGHFPVILLSVKSHSTDQAAGEASSYLENDGLMISLQNGLNNWDAIAHHVGPGRTVGGRVIFGAEVPQPGTARITVYADPVLLGAPLAPVNQDLLKAVADDMNRSKIPTHLVSPKEIHAAMWAKVLYNSALNPLSAILGVTYGELGGHPETRAVMLRIIAEIYEVMNAKGVEVPFPAVLDYFDFFIGRQVPVTADHNSSMLQDISRGRPTEIDSLNGAISIYGRQLGIKTPYNDLLTSLIKFKEANGPISP